MKTLLLASLICPNLGTFYKTCKVIQGQFSESIDLSIVQRQNTYHISSMDPATQERTVDTYKADGKVYEQVLTDEDSGESLTYTTQTSCTPTELKIITTFSGDQLTVVMKKVGNKLEQRISGQNLGQKVSASILCE